MNIDTAWFENGSVGLDINIPMNVNREHFCKSKFVNIIAMLLVRLAMIAMNDVCFVTFLRDITMGDSQLSGNA